MESRLKPRRWLIFGPAIVENASRKNDEKLSISGGF